MALSVYFDTEIRNGIKATLIASLSASIAGGAGNVEYARGLVDFAKAQATLYDIDVPEMLGKVKVTLTGLGVDVGDLLETGAKQMLEGGK